MEITRRASDALRGIAILLIVLFHAFAPARSFSTDVLGRLGIAQIGVWLFLFVSGYGICRSYGLSGIDVRRYVERRFWRVVVPYWAVVTLTIAGLLLFLPVFFSMAWMKRTVVMNYLFISFAPYDILGGGVGWFVTYILAWYAIYYLVSRLPLEEMKKIALMLVGVPTFIYLFSGAIANVVAGLFPFVQLETLSFRGLYLPYAFAFPLGVLAARIGSWRLDFRLPVLPKIGEYAYWIYLLHMELLCTLAVVGVAGYCGGWDYAVAYQHTNLGSAKFAAGDYAGALAEYDEALRLDSSQAMFYANRASTKTKLGDYAGALADFEKAVGMNPTEYLIYHNYGILKFLLKDYQGAVGAYDRAIGLNPYFADSYGNRAASKGSIGDFAGAVEDYNRALELNTGVARWHYERGFSKFMLGEQGGAKEDMDRAHELDASLPDYDAWVKSIANAAVKQGG